MAVALSGCVIIKQDVRGSSASIVYKKKCESCGYVDNSTTSTSVSNSSGSTYRSSFTCPKCRKNNSIQIQGSN
jgi:rubredoxin